MFGMVDLCGLENTYVDRANENNIEAAFFDIDGTLAIPRFRLPDGRYVCAISGPLWEKYVDKIEDPYFYCGVPMKIYRRIRRMQFRGVRMNVISTASYEKEKEAKWKFIDKRYPNIFHSTDIFFVSHSKDKVDLILKYCKTRGILPERAYLLDDSSDVLYRAAAYGIDAHHPSEYLDVCEEPGVGAIMKKLDRISEDIRDMKNNRIKEREDGEEEEFRDESSWWEK